MAEDKFDKFVVNPKKDAKSFVWSHFGHLCNKEDGRLTDSNNVYCIDCFNDKKIKVYKDTVSTTNLAQHLRDSHSILNDYVANRCRLGLVLLFLYLPNYKTHLQFDLRKYGNNFSSKTECYRLAC
jgi:hypothetical protein